jgi:hypothetical protein
MSDPIDVWHYAREAGMEAERPRVQRTSWWEAVLLRVEERRGPRWAEIGATLCNVAPPEQEELEQAMRRLRDEVGAGARLETDFVEFQNGPPQRRDVFVGVIVTSPDAATRASHYERAAGKVMQTSDLERIILLGWGLEPIPEPYYALVLFERPGT